jgi:outer membrane receptor for ferrienterochelin and colicins
MKLQLLLLVLLLSISASAQNKIQLLDKKTKLPLVNTSVLSDEKTIGKTDSLGFIIFLQKPNAQHIDIAIADYQEKSIDMSSNDSIQIVYLDKGEGELEEVTIISSSRNNEKMENSPLKIEVLGKEELSEEAGIKPGNIASILGDVSGVQIQQSSATSGNSNVRIQGLDGRYTQILRDGMPLYDGFSGGFGIMTIPPLDLQQIEMVKGSASTLYGGGAIGGLVNLISKKPTLQQEADVLINYTTLKEFNVNAYLAKRNKKWGYTLFTGYNNQRAVDVDKDGLSDLPNANSFIIHPRLFYYPSENTIIMLGYTGTFDQRKGGDMKVIGNSSDSLHQYYEHNKTERHTGEYSIEHFYSNNSKLTVKGNMSNFNRNTETNIYELKGNQTSYYSEASLYKPFGKSNLVAGINIVGDDYKTKSPDSATLKSYSNFTIGAFAQFSWHIKDNTILETGLRADQHNTYGTFVLPRIALFHRFSEQWATRLGFGMGYKVPNPLMQQTIEYNIIDILPLNSGLKPEVSYGYNAEVNYKKEWNNHTTLFINQAFFLTQVDHPIVFEEDANNKIYLINESKPLLSMGSDTYIKLKIKSWELYAGYTYTDTRRTYLSANTFIPLTPRNRMAFVVVREIEKKWRFGLEGSLMGHQYRYDGTTTPSYFFMALMLQRNLNKHFSIVLNGENLLDYRMSKVEPIYTGSISNPMFKPLWAPIDGRVINLSLRWKL